jgi:hypothetical protein
MSDADPPDDRTDRPFADRGAADRASERGGRFRRIGRRILGDSDDGRTILGDAKEVFGAVLEGGDKAKSEVVRAVAREVRNYLEELGLKDDLHHLLTNYSLEMKASINLRRLAESEKGPDEARAKAKSDEPG